MINYDVKFLTCDDTVHIKNNDFKSFKYETKKRVDETIYDSGKRSYCEKRGSVWRAAHPRQVRQLESKLRDRSIITCEWTTDSLITIVFSSGVIAYLTVKQNTLDVSQILFDKYFVGKLSGQSITNVALSKSYILVTHSDRTATLVTFGKKNISLPCRITDRDPHVQNIELGGSSRRTERHISCKEGPNGAQVLNGINLDWLRYEVNPEDRATKLSSGRDSATHVSLCTALFFTRDSRRMQLLASRSAKAGPILLANFSGGPLTLLHISHPKLLTAWIRNKRPSNAVSLLRAMDWEREGTECLWAVNMLVCAALRNKTAYKCSLLEDTIVCKYRGGVQRDGGAGSAGRVPVPRRPARPRRARYHPPLHDLARKFFHHLLRRGRIEKALSLAVDLSCWDLFCDARWAATRRALPALATEAASLALHYADLDHG
ncbi:hypothetical protein HF086_003194 [Spodoptera exigua]|uniref:Uncharacterized protein n=1 Tax=Spodoptera exigua TaxID=7107 RepID=A0A922MFL6_SPOEX|nr:hypothetical protein HF086_003194 [Spodoptera exigua]